MLQAIADMEGTIVGVKIQPIERDIIIDDPMSDLERSSAGNAKIHGLTQASAERVSIPIELTASVLISLERYIGTGVVLVNQFVQHRRRKTVGEFNWPKSVDHWIESISAKIPHGGVSLESLW
jgi:hypothetical protein